jgi:hypothetical protein
MSEIRISPSVTESDKELLQEILSGREYRTRSGMKEEGENWLVRAWDYLWSKLGGLMPEHAIPKSAADVISYLVILAGIGLVIYLLIWLGRRYAHDWKAPGQIGLSEEELQQSYGDYLRMAEAAGQRGDFKDAVRFTFLAVLFYGDSRGWLQVEKWKANGEYAMELRSNKPAVKPVFDEAVLLFEQVYYGKREANAQAFTQLYHRVAGMVSGEEGSYGKSS